jgi:hypothetical protein
MDLDANVTGLIEEFSYKLDTFQLVLHLIIICINFPLNLFIGYVLMSDKQLRLQLQLVWHRRIQFKDFLHGRVAAILVLHEKLKTS